MVLQLHSNMKVAVTGTVLCDLICAATIQGRKWTLTGTWTKRYYGTKKLRTTLQWNWT